MDNNCIFGRRKYNEGFMQNIHEHYQSTRKWVYNIFHTLGLQHAGLCLKLDYATTYKPGQHKEFIEKANPKFLLHRTPLQASQSSGCDTIN